MHPFGSREANLVRKKNGTVFCNLFSCPYTAQFLTRLAMLTFVLLCFAAVTGH